jgi:predicted double-glycine peptidase
MNSYGKHPLQRRIARRRGMLILGLGLAALLIAGAVAPGNLVETSHDPPAVFGEDGAASQAAPPPHCNPNLTSSAVSQTAAHDGFGTPLPPFPAGHITVEAVRDQVQLTGLTHQWQTWNNCGPATVTTQMSYFGRSESQADAAQFLKPNPDDKNVSPHELTAYARSVGMGAVMRQGGSLATLRLFLSNDFPVLVETWLVHDGDGLGHYRLVTGYDNETRLFDTYDSLKGINYKVPFDRFDLDWRVFNRLYIVIYPPDRAELVSNLLQSDFDDVVMYGRLVAEAQLEIEANPNDAIALFNQGEALTRLGCYQDAVVAFDRARNLGLHWRRLWYQFTPFEAYYAVGRFQDVLVLANATIRSTGGHEEAYYYRGLALKALGQVGAEDAFKAAIAYNPNFASAQEASQSLLPGQSSPAYYRWWVPKNDARK